MKSVFNALVLSLFVAGLSACKTSMNLEDGIECFKAGDYRQAFIRLKPEALKGHLEAEYAIGYMYYYGQGVVENRYEALHWIRLAAARGQPDAVKALQIIKNCN